MNHFGTTLTNLAITSDITIGAASFLFVWGFIFLAMFIFAGWMIFVKAGYAGWKSLIPFYNTYILVKMAGRPGWWFIVLFIPLIGLIVRFFVSLDLAKAFGKSTLYGVLFIWLFPIVGLLFIGWDKNVVYIEPHAG